MRYVDVEIPDTVTIIAVPADWLSYFISVKNSASPILVVRKTRPVSKEFVAGARHRFAFRLNMLPRGGIRLEDNGFKIEKVVGGKAIVRVLRRKLKYAEIIAEGKAYAEKIAEENMEELKRKAYEEILEYPGACIRSKGYLVFEKISDNEWKLSTKEPEAYVHMKRYELSSRSGVADYKIMRTKNVLKVMVDGTSTAVLSVAAMLLVLPTDRPAYLEYSYNWCPYRGECKEEVRSVRIEWNSGNPVEVEEPFPDDELEII